ncbi:MAG: FkbM family methyltransferase, partial [Sinobacteraceae bacterium]|nr:FkbM family methyltransferase [Nevskiaceae bacterium]
AQIFAFEPDPESFRLLQENLQLNRASHVTAINMALGDKPGTAELRRYNSKNNGCHTLFAGGNCEGGIAQVSVETLGHVWQQQQLGSRPLKFMKIDVEGYEYFALRGAGGLLRRCSCLVMEYTPDALQLAGQGPSAMVDCFAEAGLQAKCFVNGELQPISLEELAATRTQRDLVLTPAPVHNAHRS